MTQGKPEETCGDFGGRRNDGRECGRPSGWGTPQDSGKCRECNGTNPDGSVPDDHGAPESNGNAVKHNLDADRSKLWERMPDTRQEVFEGIVESLRERYEEYHGREPVGDEIEDFREIAWSVIEKRYARDYMAECMDETGNPLMERVTRTVDGEKVTFEQPNGLLGRISENRREDRLLKKHTGLYKDPESQQADASKEQAELVRKALQED